jgi:hypothetical protein
MQRNLSFGCLRIIPRIIKAKSGSLASLIVAALVTLPSAQAGGAPQSLPVQPANTFVILLEGPYKPVPENANVDCINLGLKQVNLCDGTYAANKIFPVSGLLAQGHPLSGQGDAENAIGNFYVQFAGIHAAYDLPGGAITMIFTGNTLQPVPDGQGGTFFVGTIQLDITEATGVYASFVGGHNDMVDILHQLADGTFVEHCFCIISRPVSAALNRLDSERGTLLFRRNDRWDRLHDNQT